MSRVADVFESSRARSGLASSLLVPKLHLGTQARSLPSDAAGSAASKTRCIPKFNLGTRGRDKPRLGLESIRLVQFFQQLLLQMPPRGFLYRPALGRDSLFLGLPLLARSRFHRAGQMRNLWAVLADLFFSWLRVGLHSSIHDLANREFRQNHSTHRDALL